MYGIIICVDEEEKKRAETVLRGQYGDMNIKIKLSDITYIQKSRYGCIIHVTREKSQNDYFWKLIVKEKLDIIYQKLHAFWFEYAHSSYLVNLKHVDECSRNQLKLDTGLRLGISRSKSKMVNESFIAYIDNQWQNIKCGGD